MLVVRLRVVTVVMRFLRIGADMLDSIFGAVTGLFNNDYGTNPGRHQQMMRDKYLYDRDIDRQNELLHREERLQKEFAQHGIQWRVEDAQRAGLHPVFALSGGGAAYSPPSVSVGSSSSGYSELSGQDISRAVRATMSPEQREVMRIQEQEVLSRITRNNAEADMFRSVTVKNYQGMNPGVPVGVDPAVMADPSFGGGNTANRVSVKPSEVTSRSGSDVSTAAGRDVAWKQYTVGADGRKIWAPNAQNFAEALEGVSESWPLTWIWIKENMARNPQFLYENRHVIPGGESWFASEGMRGRLFDILTDPDTYGRKAHERLNLRRGLNSPKGRYPNFGY